MNIKAILKSYQYPKKQTLVLQSKGGEEFETEVIIQDPVLSLCVGGYLDMNDRRYKIIEVR